MFKVPIFFMHSAAAEVFISIVAEIFGLQKESSKMPHMFKGIGQKYF